MSEVIKTISMLGAAILLVAIAYWVQPSQQSESASDQVAQLLFPSFTDATKAASLKVVELNEGQSAPLEFEVMRKKGSFVIGSKEDYPVDSLGHLEDAVNSVVGVKILGIASEVAADHERYGVVAPAKGSEKYPPQAYGTLLTIKDDGGNVLASLIIGKEASQPGLRFVRRENENVVLVVPFNRKMLSTNYQDWIQKDLLTFSGNDVLRLEKSDYSILRTEKEGELRHLRDPQAEIKVARDETFRGWNLLELWEKRGGEFAKVGLFDTEQLNLDRLNEARNEFASLKIVDFRRKSLSLAANLTAGKEVVSDQQSAFDLFERGYTALQNPNGTWEMMTHGGDLRVTTRDGVQYVLRFGNLISVPTGDTTTLGRFLMIVARVDEAAIPKPKLVEVPPDPAGGDGKKSDGKRPPLDAEARRKADDREKAIKENEKKTEQYEKAIKSARDKVRDLNHRFGDWYYVVDNNVFKKLYLVRSDFTLGRADIETFRSLEAPLEKPDPAHLPMGAAPRIAPGVSGPER